MLVLNWLYLSADRAVFCAAKFAHTGRHAPQMAQIKKEVPKYG